MDKHEAVFTNNMMHFMIERSHYRPQNPTDYSSLISSICYITRSIHGKGYWRCRSMGQGQGLLRKWQKRNDIEQRKWILPAEPEMAGLHKPFRVNYISSEAQHIKGAMWLSVCHTKFLVFGLASPCTLIILFWNGHIYSMSYVGSM